MNIGYTVISILIFNYQGKKWEREREKEDGDGRGKCKKIEKI